MQGKTKVKLFVISWLSGPHFHSFLLQEFLKPLTFLHLLVCFKTHFLDDFPNLCNTASVRDRNLSLHPQHGTVPLNLRWVKLTVALVQWLHDAINKLSCAICDVELMSSGSRYGCCASTCCLWWRKNGKGKYAFVNKNFQAVPFNGFNLYLRSQSWVAWPPLAEIESGHTATPVPKLEFCNQKTREEEWILSR